MNKEQESLITKLLKAFLELLGLAINQAAIDVISTRNRLSPKDQEFVDSKMKNISARVLSEENQDYKKKSDWLRPG